MLHIPTYVEYLAIVVGAASGALHAWRHDADAVGLVALSISTGLGGGILRDVLIGRGTPVALSDSGHLVLVTVLAAVAWLAGESLERLKPCLESIDALLLGLWVVMGVEKALTVGLPVAPAAFLGVVTAAGGGVIRDVLSGEPPDFVRPGRLNVGASTCGAALYVLVVSGLRLPRPVAEVSAIALASGLRLLGLHRGWRGPDLRRRTTRRTA